MRARNVKSAPQRVLSARPLPPLELLPGFEASARLLSFSKAAEELYLTQSAISRQIKSLEDYLGLELFIRGHRSLTLTAAGVQFFPVCRDVLERIRQATGHLRAAPEGRSVTITTVPGFASLWLIPRLARFALVAPAVDVRIAVSHRVVDLEREMIDLAVRYCSPEAVKGPVLFEEQFQPVCSPRLAAITGHALAGVDDLRHHALLDIGGEWDHAGLVDWELWLRAVDFADLRPLRTISFSQYDSVVAAAVDGQGVAMGRIPLINEYLRDGRLIAPFASTHASAKAYCLIRGPHSERNPAARLFIQWLIDETGRDRAARGV